MNNFKVGDEICLKQDVPKMTITELYEVNGQKRAKCQWDNNILDVPIDVVEPYEDYDILDATIDAAKLNTNS